MLTASQIYITVAAGIYWNAELLIELIESADNNAKSVVLIPAIKVVELKLKLFFYTNKISLPITDPSSVRALVLFVTEAYVDVFLANAYQLPILGQLKLILANAGTDCL